MNCIVLTFALLASCYAQNQYRHNVQRQPHSRSSYYNHVEETVPRAVNTVNCPSSKVTGCLAHLMALNVTAVVDTFKVYELLSFTNIDEARLRQQARVAHESCHVFNQFNDCTGGNFLQCFDKQKFIGIIKGFASVNKNPSTTSGMSMINDIAAIISDEQIDFVGNALIDVCKRIRSGDVQLAELAMCIRKDSQLISQLESLKQEETADTQSYANIPVPHQKYEHNPYPLAASTHCKVFRCDVSRTIVHMLVQAAHNCSDNKGSDFIFRVGQIGLTGIKKAAPSTDIKIATGEFGTMSSSQDKCDLRDKDLLLMRRQRPRSFQDLGISRASEMCAKEVATTTLPTTIVFKYGGAQDGISNFKINIEDTFNDIDDDLFWETSAASILHFSPIILSILLMV